MHYSRATAVILALTVAAASRSTFADDPDPFGPYTFLPNSGTYTNQSPMGTGGGATAIVGYTAQDPSTLGFTGPTSPNIVMSTNSGWGANMWIYNATVLTLSGGDQSVTPTKDGGSVALDLLALNTSTIFMSELGFAKEVEIYDSTNLYMNGGTIGISNNQNGYSFLGLQGSSTAHLSAGTIYGGIDAANGATTVIISGAGIYGSVQSDGVGASVMMTSGFISGSVGIDNGAVGSFMGGTYGSIYSGGTGAHVTISAGTVNGMIQSSFGGVISLTGGTALGIGADSGGVTTLAGGTVNGDGTASGGTLNLNSGVLTGNLYAYSSGVINVNGVTIMGNVFLTTGGKLNLNSGSIPGTLSINGGTINLGSGSVGSLALAGNTSITFNHAINGALSLTDNARLEIDTAAVTGTVQTNKFSALTMTGGSTGAASAYDSSTMYLSGGQMQGLSAYNDSFVFISGPLTVTGDLNTTDSSTALVEAGTVTGKLIASGSSTIYLYDGTVHGLEAHGFASINWYGGTVANSNTIYLHDSSTLSILGINLSTTLINANAAGFSVYALSGYSPTGVSLANFQLYLQNPVGANPGASVSFSPADQNWNFSAGGSWITPANWAPNIVPNSIGASVVFSDANPVNTPANLHIPLNANVTLGSLLLATANNIIIDPGAGGSFTFRTSDGSAARINVSNSNAQINVPVSLQVDTNITVGQSEEDDVVSGIVPNARFFSSATLTLSQGVNVASGSTLHKYGQGALLVPFVRGGNLDLEEGTLKIAANGTSAGASRVDGLNVNSYGSLLDLTNNSLLIHNTTGGAIQPMLQSAYDSGAWDGYGISSSTAAATSGHTLGFLTGAQFLALHPGAAFDGAAVVSTDVLVKYPIAGDANLDGTISADDYLQLDQSFLENNFDGVNTFADWFNGDFNYDNVVNYLDYAIIDAEFLAQSGTLADGMIAEHASEFGAPYVAALAAINPSAIPEPTTLLLLATGALALLSQPRRRPSEARA